MAGENSLFSLLASRYGVSGALSLLSLLNPQGSGASKGFGAAQGIGTGLQGAGSLFGNPALSFLGKGIGTLGGLAGIGYGASKLAGAGPVPEKGVAAGQLGVQAAPAIYGGLSSGLAGLSSGLASGGLGALGGYGGSELGKLAFGKSREAGLGSGSGAATGALIGTLLLPGIGSLLGGLLGGFGGGGLGSLFYSKPTTGTLFRNELGSVFKQIPQLKGTDLSKYNIDLNMFNALDPKAREAGTNLGKILAAYAPSGKKDPNAYAIQAQNILLNRYGNQMGDIFNQILPLLQQQQQSPPRAQQGVPNA